MSTGRYHIVTKAGRRFTVEPIAERHQKIDGHVFTNGGIGGDDVKNKQSGGSIREEDSVITPENGYTKIITLPPGHSPNGFIEAILACDTIEEENALGARYSS
jgi:hypothetical protein